MKLFVTAQDLARNEGKAQEIGNPLDRLDGRIPWERFRPTLESAIGSLKKPQPAPGGRPAWDVVLMFKILILQRVYNISDAQMEYQILDRLSFQRFLGIEIGGAVPDEKTIWLFKNNLAKIGAGKKLFQEFDRFLVEHKLALRGGVILDASFIEMPHQHLSKEEKQAVDENKTPDGWEKVEKQPQVRQKDLDATWTKKNDRSFFGYKDHVKVDADSKLIVDFEITTASVHDSQVFKTLITSKDEGSTVWADSAYEGLEYLVHSVINKVEYDVHEKAYRNCPLSDKQKADNRERSKIRARVEHVFGFMENSMNGMRLRTIGKQRTSLSIGLMNLVYNFFRYEQLVRA
jgi:transposase, IS5 family